MARYIHFEGHDPEEIEKELREIPKTPGICFFIDLVNSTMIKYESGIEAWGRILNNSFNFISFLNDLSHNIVKGIGDEIMVFIPDKMMGKHPFYKDYFTVLQELYATLDNIKHFPNKGDLLNCKIGIHYCTEVYNITFLKGFNDYYGRDIDLTARLMSKTRTNRIVLSEAFYRKVEKDHNEKYSSYRQSVFNLISEKYLEDFKGVPQSTEYRIINV
jgi:class 3 adenylate cyclase